MLTWTPWLWAWTRDSVHISVEQFRAMLPQFADPEKYPDWMIEMQIMAATCKFNPCVWGCQMYLGEAYWIAHQLTVSDLLLTVPPISTTAAVASKKVGDTQITYVQSSATAAAAAAAENPYLWTKYGQLYQQLASSLPVGVGIMIV